MEPVVESGAVLLQLLIGVGLIALTVIIHAVALDGIIRIAPSIQRRLSPLPKFGEKSLLMAAVILLIFMAHIVEIWVWTLCFFEIGALHHMESALYFSISTFTTVGYGDVILDPNWRILGSIESANGFILFGWSTAFIFEFISNLYKKEGDKI